MMKKDAVDDADSMQLRGQGQLLSTYSFRRQYEAVHYIP